MDCNLSIIRDTCLLCSIPDPIEEWLIVCGAPFSVISYHDVDVWSSRPVIEKLLVLCQVKLSRQPLQPQTYRQHDSCEDYADEQGAKRDWKLFIAADLPFARVPVSIALSTASVSVAKVIVVRRRLYKRLVTSISRRLSWINHHASRRGVRNRVNLQDLLSLV